MTDDKMYIVMRADYWEEGADNYPLGVAMSKEAANVYVKAHDIEDGTLTAEEYSVHGTCYRQFEMRDGYDSAVYIAVVPTI